MRTPLRAVLPIVLAAVGLTSALPVIAVATPNASSRAAKLPSAPQDVKLAATLTGVDLRWTPAPDANDDGVTGYNIHRVGSDGVDTVMSWQPAWNDVGYQWHESLTEPGATYSVAAVNAEGEGAASTPVLRPTVNRSITVGHTIWLQNGNTLTYAGQIADPNGQQVVPIAPDGPTQVIGEVVASSPDGRELAFVRGQSEIWRIAADRSPGTPVKVLGGSSGIVRLAYSPDQSKIAYERLQPDSSSCIEIVPRLGGTPVQVGCGLSMPPWSPDGTELLDKDAATSRLARVQPVAGGAILGTYPGTEQGILPTASPDGRWIGYIDGNAPAVIPVGGGTPKRGTPTEQRPTYLSWYPDGTELLMTQPISFGGSALVDLPVGTDGTVGAGRTVYRTQGTDRIGSALWQGPRAMISPTSGQSGPTVRMLFDGASFRTYCQFDAEPYAPCSGEFVRSGVPTGLHTLRVKAVDGQDHASVSFHTVNVDATPPAVRITGPTFDATTASTATVTYTATDNSGVNSYDSRWRIAPTAGNFGAYATIKSGTAATSVQIGLAPGYEYCVSVRARDTFGNVSPWTADRCFSRPSDDRAMSMTAGWARVSNRLYYLGTATVTKSAGVAIARSSVQAKRLFVVATRCSACGTLTVYYNGKSVGTVNLAYPRLVYQAIVPLPVPATFLTGSVLLRTTTAGKVYQIDGLVVRRT
ncbi:MAG: hypothetical protein HOV67_27645, partial [Kribbellaceae bacterium]|nr:hypothetical protein [Kribbellaceae bacterium]